MSPRSKTRLSDQLAEHARGIAAANQRDRAVERERQAVQADAERLQAERIDALAGGDDERAERLQAERGEAERAAGDLGDRLTAARLAAERAEGARQLFASDNIAGLLAEHEGDARAAVDAVMAALDQLQAAQAQWREAETTTAHLLRLAGQGQERTPAFPGDLADLIRRLGRAQADVPLPLPRGALTGTREQRHGSPLAVR